MSYFGASEHGLIVKATCFCGYFLLICSLGTFGSTVLLLHNEDVAKSQWLDAAGHVKGCWVASQDPIIRIGSGKYSAVLCEITYQHSGQTYRETLASRFTRSVEERSAIAAWMARSSEYDVRIRIDPSNPDRFFVQSSLPFHPGDDPKDFAHAAMFMFALGLILTAIGRRLIRAGW